MKYISLILVLCTVGFASIKSPLTPEMVKKSVSEIGAKKTLVKIFENPKLEEQLLAGVSSGATAWLDIAQILKPVSDAGSSEGLNIATAEALPQNVKGVLALLGKDFPLDRVCSIPFIEPSDARIAKYFKKAEAALTKNTDPNQKEVTAQCLAVLRETKEITDMTPASVEKQIKKTSAEQVWKTLESKPAFVDKIANTIQYENDAAWIKTAAKLRRVATKPSSEKLDQAISKVLLLKPSLVLSQFGNGFELSEVCTVKLYPSDQRQQFFDDALLALSKINGGPNEEKAKACIKSLMQSKE